MRDEALAQNLTYIERPENKEQFTYMALKWNFHMNEKIGRRHNITLTEDGMNALTFLSPS